MRIITKNARVRTYVHYAYVFVKEDREMYVMYVEKKRDEERTTHKNSVEEKVRRGRCIRKREKKECSRKSGVTP